MIRIVRTRKPCVPTRDVNGPPPPGLYRTRLPETYAARTRPMAAKPNAARRSVSRSISPSPINSSTTWTYFLGIDAVGRPHVMVHVQQQREGPEQRTDDDHSEHDAKVIDEKMSQARGLREHPPDV